MPMYARGQVTGIGNTCFGHSEESEKWGGEKRLYQEYGTSTEPSKMGRIIFSLRIKNLPENFIIHFSINSF